MDRNKATNALRRYSGVGKKEKYCYICTEKTWFYYFVHILVSTGRKYSGQTKKRRIVLFVFVSKMFIVKAIQ